LDYDFDRQAPRPDRWLEFLLELWPDDPESIATLQEWFGYTLTPDTSLQKILALIGPTRSGKGTINRVQTALVGEANVVNPTLASFAHQFGRADLIGKTLATIADARLSGRTDTAPVVEHLLAISGEDPQTIPRKFLPDWHGKLSTRFMLISNELPRLTDASAAMPKRFVILKLTRSFLGREDTELTEKLKGELPGILWWAIAGWARLRQRGHFLQPESARGLVEDMEELASLVLAFVRDECVVGPEHSVEKRVLFDRWKQWCEDKNHREVGNQITFGRNLHAAVDGLTDERPRGCKNGTRARQHKGIGLK
jgi:putative DNA primase/helicase